MMKFKNLKENKIRKVMVGLLVFLCVNIFAQNLQLDPNTKYNTSLDSSQNGISIVNISTPNGRGISVNEFLEYNVDKKGQILNNSDNVGRSHLAGLINSNPNLSSNQSANLIVLQVNGSNRSDILGYIENFSRNKSNVILSNENGIFFDGAGTINVKTFIPTTGRVKFNGEDFVGIDVNRGKVVVGGKGFDGKEIDYLGVMSKAMELYGKLVGNSIEVIAGENVVSANGVVTNKRGGLVNRADIIKELGFNNELVSGITIENNETTTPIVAIDASTIGSMYGGQIRLIVTDRGVGVRSGNFLLSKDKKLEITSDGRVVIAKAQGNGIEINSGELNVEDSLLSDKDIDIQSSEIENNGSILALDNVNIKSNNLINNKEILGKNGKLEVNNLENNDLIAFERNLDIKGDRLLNKEGKSIYTGENLNIEVSNVENKRGEIFGSDILIKGDNVLNEVGLIEGNNIHIKANTFKNIGEVTDLDKYRKYYTTWDNVELSEEEVKDWEYNLPRYFGEERKEPPVLEKVWKYFNNLVDRKDNINGFKSLILTKYSHIPRKTVGQRTDITYKTKDTRINEDALVGKLESYAKTNYSKIVGTNNVTIDANNILNKDGIISSGNITKLIGDTFENSVTTGNSIQLLDGEERIRTQFQRRKKKLRRYYSGNIDYERKLVNGTLTYEAGQPSIVEGKEVVLNVNNVVLSPIKEGQGQTNEGTPSYNTRQTNGKIEIVGNNKDLKEILNTGIVGINTNLSSSMFIESVEPDSKYLIETRGNFVKLNSYYGSDYFLNKVGYKDNWDRVRRLGDAYYENRLIAQSLQERLGSQFLNGVSGEELLKQLIENAKVEKENQGLVIGKPLTKEQRSNLKNDILWYVYKEVKGVKVLAPEIYLTNHTMAMTNDDTRSRVGGFEYTHINTDRLENNGSVLGNKGTTKILTNTLKNKSVTNLVSELVGDNLYIKATGDIQNVGGKILATKEINLTTTGDILNETTKRTVNYYNNELDRTSHEEIGNVGEIRSEGTLNIQGNNYVSKGALTSSKELNISVKDNVDIQEITLSGEDKYGKDSNNFNRYREVKNVGSTVLGKDSVNILSGKDITIRGSEINSSENVFLKGENISIENTKDILEEETKSKSKNGLVGKNVRNIYDYVESVNKSQIVGKDVEIVSTNDTDIRSSNIVGEDISLQAGKDVKIYEDNLIEVHNVYEKKSGVSFSGKISLNEINGNVGYNSTKTTANNKETKASVSTIYSEKDTNILANNEVNSKGTNFVANNLMIEGNKGIKLVDARESIENSYTRKSRGINVGFSVSNRVSELGKNAVDLVGGLENFNNLANTVLNTIGNVRELSSNIGEVADVIGNAKNAKTLVSANVSLGVSNSRIRSETREDSSVGGSIRANNVALISKEDITVRNQRVDVEKNFDIKGKNIAIEGGENRYRSTNVSSSKGISVSYDLISRTGNVGINRNQNKGNERGTSYTNSEFNVGNSLSISSEKNTKLRGVNIKADEIRLDTKGDLKLSSLQEEVNGSSRGSSVGIGYGNRALTGSIGINKGTKDISWVNNQSSINVKSGIIEVGATTELNGSVIVARDEVILKTKNLIAKDISDKYGEKSVGVELSGTTKTKIPQTTLNYQNNQREQENRVTLSNVKVVENGNVVNLEDIGINEDIRKSQEITRDKSIEFNGSLHTDLLDKETRDKFTKDVTRTLNLPKKLVDGINYHRENPDTELLKDIRASVRDLNIEVLLKDDRLRKEYNEKLEKTKIDGKLTDRSLDEVTRVIKGVLAQNGLRDIEVIYSTSDKIQGSVAKVSPERDKFIINLSNIDVSNYDNLVELMQYEGQRFGYKDKNLDDRAVKQGIDLHSNLGITNITKDSELLARGNEKVDSLDLGEYRNRDLSGGLSNYTKKELKKIRSLFLSEIQRNLITLSSNSLLYDNSVEILDGKIQVYASGKDYLKLSNLLKDFKYNDVVQLRKREKSTRDVYSKVTSLALGKNMVPSDWMPEHKENLEKATGLKYTWHSPKELVDSGELTLEEYNKYKGISNILKIQEIGKMFLKTGFLVDNTLKKYNVRNNVSNYKRVNNPLESNIKYDHIIGGDVTKKGNKVSGGHSLVKGDVKIKNITKLADKNGVYEAKIEILNKKTREWQLKGKETTMFPEDWSEKRIIEEINSAWNSEDFNITVTKNGKEWTGKSKSGIEIKGYINPNGTTAYPIYEGGK